jgi:hypothetical protein
MNESTTLASALRAAAAELQLQSPPPDLQARVVARALAAARHAKNPPKSGAGREVAAPRRGGWAWSGAAVCASVLVGSAVLMLRPPLPLPAALEEGWRAGGFMPLVPPERWPQDTAQAWLVSTELQGERLAALGLPYDPARAGNSVRAELLLRPSGEVLAVRFLD